MHANRRRDLAIAQLQAHYDGTDCADGWEGCNDLRSGWRTAGWGSWSIHKNGVHSDRSSAIKYYTTRIKHSNFNETKWLLEEMRHQGLLPDVITYSAAISACEKGKQADGALQLMQEMRHQGLLPDIITYSAAISASEKGKQADRALHLM